MSDDDTAQDIPDGWVREELIAGMDTVGNFALDAEYVGMGGGYKCDHCQHFIPIESVDDATCVSCGTRGMIGTVIMGTQEVTALYPEGWFGDEDRSVDTGSDHDVEYPVHDRHKCREKGKEVVDERH